jgi:hypothetical protein
MQCRHAITYRETFISGGSRQLEADLESMRLPLHQSLRKLSQERRNDGTGSISRKRMHRKIAARRQSTAAGDCARMPPMRAIGKVGWRIMRQHKILTDDQR